MVERESDLMDTQYNNVDTAMEEKYINILKRKIIQSMVKLEGININNMTEDEILNEMFKFIDNADIELVIDYTDSILKQARNLYKDGHNELACLLYATWFEHWINDIVTTLCRRKNLKEKDVKEIVRSV